MSRHEFAGAPIVLTTATTPPHKPGQPRRIVALGWISRTGGQVIISEQLTNSNTAGR